MDPFEKKIMALPWHRPSSDLRSRIFDAPATQPIKSPGEARRIALRWAAVLVLMASLAGYLAGQYHAQRLSAAPVSEPEVDLQVVETGSGQNLFDMTPHAGEILPGELVATHIVVEEY